MKYPAAFASLVLGTLLPAASGRAATLEAYFDFTKYGQAAVGSTIASNVHGDVSATVKTAITPSGGAGLAIGPDLDAASTGVVLPPGALASMDGDFTLQIWYQTGEYVGRNTLLLGGTTSAVGDDSLAGDQAFFVGYNNHAGRAQFIRPITSDGTRWGAHLGDTPVGTGTAPGMLHDYVLVYESGARRISAYMDGALVGEMGAGDFSGLGSLTGGLAVGGVQNSAFAEDRAAAVNIASFLMYRGALAPAQLAQIHACGPDITKTELQGAGVTVAADSPAAPTVVVTPDAASDAARPTGTPLRRHRR